MLTEIKIDGVRGKTIQAPLTQRTLIVGPNGTGKTSLRIGAQLAILGYVPGESKEAAAIMENAAGNSMGVEVTVNGKAIGRRWTRSPKGTVSCEANVDGHKAPAKSADGMIAVALGSKPVLVDMTTFWKASDRLRRHMLLQASMDAKEADAILDAESKARETANACRQRRERSAGVVAQLAARMTALPAIAGGAQQLAAELDTVDKAMVELRDRMSKGEQNDQERIRLRALVARRDVGTKLDDIKAEQAKAAETIQSNETEKVEIKEKYDVLISVMPAAMEKVVREASERISELMVLAETGPLAAELAEVRDALESVVMPADKRLELEGRKNTMRQRLVSLNESTDHLRTVIQTAARRLGELQQQSREGESAERLLAKVGPGVVDEDRRALAGLEEQRKALAVKLEGIAQRATVEAEVERSKVAADEAMADEEKAKAAVAVAIEAQREAFQGVIGLLTTAAATILPDGRLAIEDGENGLRIGWARETAKVWRDTLSGSEQAIFDAAFARAMAGPDATVFIEAGEVQDSTLAATLSSISKASGQGQVVVCRWMEPDHVWVKPDGWSAVLL